MTMAMSPEAAAQRARNQRWYALNRDKAIAKAKARHAEKRDEILPQMAAYRELNRDAIREQISTYRRGEGRAKKAASDAAYALANPEKVAAYRKAFAQRHPEKILAKNQKRRAAKLERVNMQDQELLALASAEANDLARRRTALTGEPWELDHRVPLQGESVSGLHNPFNFNVIPRRVNRRKSASFVA
jgi:hypothetical protein